MAKEKREDEMTVSNPTVEELKEMEKPKKRESLISGEMLYVPEEAKYAGTVELKQEEKVDLVTPEKVNEIVAEWQYPDASYAFSVAGRNGSQILENKEDVSPTDRMILTMEEAKLAIDRGFTLRWTVSGYETSAWFNQILAKWNFDFFAAFIKGEIEAGRLNKYSF
jgi:hypothetical protein